MAAPLVSVLLPALNAASTIEAAVASLRAQTLQDLEIVVVDDGSVDDTPRLLARMAEAEPRLKVLRQPQTGLVAALDRGLQACAGRYLARMDADDVSYPERLEAQLALLAADVGPGVASCLVDFDGPEAALGYAEHVRWANSLVSPEAISLGRFVDSPIPHPTVCMERSLILSHGGYRQGDFPEDFELWLRLMDQGVRFAKVDRPLLLWRDHPGRASRRDPRYRVEAFYRLKAEYLARWLSRHNPHHPEVWVVGAGRVARIRAELLVGHGVGIAGYVDIDPAKIGRRLAGRPVVGRAGLPGPDRCFVLSYVGTRGARDEIMAFLEETGYVQGRDCLAAA